MPKSISGTVIDSVTEKPLDGVHIKLVIYSEDGFIPGLYRTVSGAYGAMSDAAGHFSITSLPPPSLPRWEYRIKLERHGFVMVPGKKDSAAADGSIELRMAPQAIISGRVVDEYGDPIMGVLVKPIPVARYKLENGDPDLLVTNDRGEFRSSLEPGKYYITAGAVVPVLDERSQRYHNAANTAESAYHITFYPNARDITAATPVEAKSGREINGLEIRLVRTPALKISGVALANADCLSRPNVVAESDEDTDDIASYRSVTWLAAFDHKSGDRFQYSRLEPGLYRVYALCVVGDHQLKSEVVEVTLTDSNVENVTLALEPGPDIHDLTGKVEWTASSSRSPARKRSRTVTLQPKTASGTRCEAEVAPDGTFKIKDVHPDRYRVEIDLFPEEGAVMSVRLNGTPVTDGVLDLTNGAEGARLRIKLSANGGQVAGRVADETDGTAPSWGTVVIFKDQGNAAALDAWCVPDWSYCRDSVADGNYSFRGLGSGTYRLLATPRSFDNEPEFEKFIKQNRDKGEIFEIKKEGDRIAKDLKMPSADPDETTKNETKK